MRNPRAARFGPVDQGDRPAAGDFPEHRQDASRECLPEAGSATAHPGNPQSARAGPDSVVQAAKLSKSPVRAMAPEGLRPEIHAMKYALTYGLLSGLVIIVTMIAG